MRDIGWPQHISLLIPSPGLLMATSTPQRMQEYSGPAGLLGFATVTLLTAFLTAFLAGGLLAAFFAFFLGLAFFALLAGMVSPPHSGISQCSSREYISSGIRVKVFFRLYVYVCLNRKEIQMKGPSVRTGRAAKGFAGLVAVIMCVHLLGLSPGLAAGADSKQPTAQRNQVAGVKGFAMDFDSGCMAIQALGSALEATGHSSPYGRLAALSGAGFKFVYDTTEAYEPLRDLFPIDVLQTACKASGFPEACWKAGLPMAEVKAIVKREIDAGRPLLASFLKADAYHGIFLIVGYDYQAGVFYLQGASRDSSYTSVPIPEKWDGSTASPAGWADNPVFILGAYDQGRASDTELGLDKVLITNGINLLKGGTLAYGSHPGEQSYMGEPGSHQCVHGIPAYRLLSLDVGSGDLIVKRGGQDEVDFGLVWRLDAQLGQLESDRVNAVTGLSYLVPRVSAEKSVEVDETMANIRKTVADVATLRKIFWDQIPHQVNTPEGIAAYVKSSESMVFSFAGSDQYFQDLRDRGLRTFKTRRGPVIIEDSPEKRLRARMLVRSLEARERTTLVMLEGIENYLGANLSVPPAERRTGGPRQRR